MTEEADWDNLRALAQQVFERGVALELSAETRALLLRTARQVAIRTADAEAALSDLPGAKTLLQEIRRRIREGSDRLSDALNRAYRLRDGGDLRGARKQMEHLLAVEVVPLYREQAEIMLEELDRMESQR